MRLQILAVGRMKAGPEQELYDRFSDRIEKIGKSLKISGPEIVEIVESRRSLSGESKADEASQLVSKLDEEARLIALDERGTELSSQGFSQLIAREQESGTRTLAFAIGGPDGHGPELLSRSFQKIRFGSMTWPHQLARVMLVEQLYRACTILTGHPYHRK